PSLFTWDVLFLIPVPWTGPVLAPVLVSGALVAGSLLLLRLHERGVQLGFSAPVWTMAVTGGLLVLGSFVIDFASILRQMVPPPKGKYANFGRSDARAGSQRSGRNSSGASHQRGSRWAHHVATITSVPVAAV